MNKKKRIQDPDTGIDLVKLAGMAIAIIVIVPGCVLMSAVNIGLSVTIAAIWLCVSLMAWASK